MTTITYSNHSYAGRGRQMIELDEHMFMRSIRNGYKSIVYDMWNRKMANLAILKRKKKAFSEICKFKHAEFSEDLAAKFNLWHTRRKPALEY